MASRRDVFRRALRIQAGREESYVRYEERQEVDFVVVGSGAAGGILAKELSTAGFSVVVLEQGPYLKSSDFGHDELAELYAGEGLMGSLRDFPQTIRRSEDEEAQIATGLPPLMYARLVGGSSAHFTANFWRFRPIDFQERSVWGDIPGTGFADWPITYEELEPYYTKVDWEIGVSGAPGPSDPPRSRPYPMPPLPVTARSDGDPLATAQRALTLPPLRVLSGVRV
jgi:choline dehydrogenase-like flavoprotein